ncbi:MAG: RloB family protein, partial [Clostridiales bacterium]|nr:RloB family protein [Clostridiales bacterium]
LKEYFPYEKNLENIYDILRDRTQAAIAHAKALYNSYEEGTPPSQRAPATRVHELVAFLQNYL